MMRIDRTAVVAVAKELCTSGTASAWPYVSDEIREALIDRTVMDCVRHADENTPVTPGQLVEFRGEIMKTLEDGVFVGKTKRGLMLDSVREDRRMARVRQEEAELDRSKAVR